MNIHHEALKLKISLCMKENFPAEERKTFVVSEVLIPFCEFLHFTPAGNLSVNLNESVFVGKTQLCKRKVSKTKKRKCK